MRKSILVLSGLGIGAGVLYAIGTRTGDKSKSNRRNGGEVPTGETADNGEDHRPIEMESTERRGNGIDESKASSMASASSAGSQSSESERTEPIDDQGTGQDEASAILKTIRDDAFAASNERLALALGRPTEEIDAWLSGAETIDGDVLMKARHLAMERGVNAQ
jgi:hypothetical protein